MIRSAAALTASKLFFKAALFVFVLILARTLTPSDFADFQFVSGLANMLAQPLHALSMIAVYVGMSIDAHQDRGRMSWLLRAGGGLAVGLAAIILLVFAVIDRPLAAVAGIGVDFAVTLGGAIIAATVVFQAACGFLLVQHRFTAMAGAFCVLGVATLAGGYALAAFDMGQLAAYAVQAAALLAAATVALVLLAIGLPAPARPDHRVIDWLAIKYALKFVVTILAFFVVANTDVLAAKIILPAAEAELYIQQELVSRLFFVLASSVGVIIFAKVMVPGSETLELPLFHPLSLLAAAVLVGGITLGSDFLIDGIFGRDVDTDPVLVALLLSGRIAQSVVFILISSLGEKLSRRFTGTMLACACLEVGLMVFVADGPHEIAGVMFLVSGLSLFLMSRLLRHGAITETNGVVRRS